MQAIAPKDPGKYKVIAELGQGGMANVYLAVARGPSGFNKLVVLKSLRSDFAVEQELMAMFLEEARLAARLNHPHVVQTNEVGEYAGRPVIVMEYLEGQTLANVEQRAKTRLSLAMHLRILIEALEGLHHAHELADFAGKPLGLVHRDVSPQNVFITFDGHVKVVDFGIAKVVNSQVQTATGIIKGKVRYMAPEQMLSAANLDRRADLYSIGVMVWEAATGRGMWQGCSDMQVMTSIAQGDVSSPRTANPDVSEGLEAICMQALAREPANRYATALEMAGALEGELERLGTGASNRQIGLLVRELFEDVRARTRAIIEAQLLDASAGSDSGTHAIPSNLVNIATRISEESPSAANGSFDGFAPAHASGNQRVAAWTAAAALSISIATGVVAFAALRHQKQVAPSATSDTQSSAGAAPTPSLTPAAATASLSPPAPSPSVTMSLSATPARATLSLDGRTLPSNPYTVAFPQDGATHRVHAEALGYAPRTLTLFPPDHNTDLSIALEPVRGGGLRASAPSSASVQQPLEPRAGTKSNNCSPPYVIDADGIKRFRPECLPQ